MFCGKAFQILGPNVARLLSPKVTDLRAFTKMLLGLTLAFSFAEKILFMEIEFRSFIVLNISKTVSLFPSTVFSLVSVVFDNRLSNNCK